MKPFRILALILLLIAILEGIAIASIDTYEKELREARLRYEGAKRAYQQSLWVQRCNRVNMNLCPKTGL